MRLNKKTLALIGAAGLTSLTFLTAGASATPTASPKPATIAPALAAIANRSSADAELRVLVQGDGAASAAAAHGRVKKQLDFVWLGLWRLTRLNPVETLIAALAGQDADAWLLRADIVRVLGKLGDRRAVAPVVDEIGQTAAAVTLKTTQLYEAG
jgi:hypothetical protein